MALSAPEDQLQGLTPTGRVILGMIAFGKRTGYDIKAFVDKTTRYFWAASAALEHWLESDEETLYELRDEGMLKLFFSDSLPEGQIEIVRAMRTREERALAHLRLIEPHASKGPKGSYLTLQLGIGLTEWTSEWCKATERQLATETEKE